MVTIITDVRVPAEQFPLGRVLQGYPDVSIELERIVPTHDGIVPLFWVDRGNERAVSATLRADPLVEDIAELTRTQDRVLYSVTWSPDVDALVRPLVEFNVDILSARSEDSAWTFRLQFRNRTALKQFRRACRDDGIDLQLVELFNPLMPQEKGPLTAREKDILATAYENGYWDIPRKTSQRELATLIGVDDALLSRELRDGVKATVGALLFGPGGRPYESTPRD